MLKFSTLLLGPFSAAFNKRKELSQCYRLESLIWKETLGSIDTNMTIESVFTCDSSDYDTVNYPHVCVDGKSNWSRDPLFFLQPFQRVEPDLCRVVTTLPGINSIFLASLTTALPIIERKNRNVTTLVEKLLVHVEQYIEASASTLTCPVHDSLFHVSY